MVFPLLRSGVALVTSQLVGRLFMLVRGPADPLRHLYFFHALNEVSFAIVGRLLLFNVDSLADQLGSAILWSLLEFSARAMAPSLHYARWRPLRGHTGALRKAEEFRLSPLTYHHVFFKSSAELAAIVVAPAFNAAARALYGLPAPPLWLSALSALVQLSLELVADGCSAVVEGLYLSYDLGVWQRGLASGEYRAVFLHTLPLFCSLGAYAVFLIHGDATA